MVGAALAVVLAGCTPAGPRALLDGKRLLDAGQYEQAVERLKVATSLLNTNAQAWNYLGVAWHRAGRMTNALAAYRKSLDLDRDLLEARYNLGCLWLEANRPELAKAEFTSYTLRRGHAVEGWLKLGTAQLRARELTAAEKSFREAVRINQNQPEALNGLGLVQLQRGRAREAVQYFSAALKQQPDYRPALLNLATVSQQYLNDRAAALQHYREYLALRPRPADWETVSTVVKVLELPQSAPPRASATNPVAASPVVTTTGVTKPATSAVAQSPAPKTEVPAPTKKVEAAPLVKAEPQPQIAKPAAPLIPPATNPAVVAPIAATTAVIQTPPPKTGAPPAQTAVEVVTLPPEPVIIAAPQTLPATAAVSRDGEAETNSTIVRESAPPDLAAVARTRDEKVGSPGATIPTASRQRYTYVSPAKPVAGNRREAERAFAQGQQAQRANRLAEAAQAYRQATQSDPSYFEAHYNLALVAFAARSFGQSLSAWENALAIQPDSVDARYNLALALKAANYPADAANELKQILAVNANETRAHLVLGNLWAEELDDSTQARAHYLRVLELDPRHPQATAIRYWLVAHPL
jgi:tetratricopeptide (TPR) repeat protein